MNVYHSQAMFGISILALAFCLLSSRPSEDGLFQMEVYQLETERTVYRLNQRTGEIVMFRVINEEGKNVPKLVEFSKDATRFSE